MNPSLRRLALASVSSTAFIVGLYQPFARARFGLNRAQWELIFSRFALNDQGTVRFVEQR